ncbi:MAG: glycosyltransferase family 39 protein, partial [Planctomycetes bacterium]|nr:glycosyltransferase family 39 protein [Planctomycetota bacterium]
PYRYGSDQGWIMRMPGYPLFLTGIIAPCLAVWPLDRPEDNVLFLTPLVPQHLLIARLIHAILGTLTVYLVYLLTKVIRNRKSAQIAAAMAACYPPFILFSVVILSETLFSVFLLLQLLVTLKIIQLCKAEPTIKQRWRQTFLRFISGILWGLATLTRASWLLS